MKYRWYVGTVVFLLLEDPEDMNEAGDDTTFGVTQASRHQPRGYSTTLHVKVGGKSSPLKSKILHSTASTAGTILLPAACACLHWLACLLRFAFLFALFASRFLMNVPLDDDE